MKALCCCIVFMAYCATGGAQGMAMPYIKQDKSLNVFVQKISLPFYTGIATTAKMKAPVPGDFYTKNFGFFCRQELKMYKAHVPLSFRLGSVEYCDQLEQKGCSAK